jgi:ATP-binding cassette subfamily B protein/subfamily B ATP-binding cassette protein MsbA
LRNLSISLGAIVLFVYGSYLARTGSLTVGEFVAFLFYYFMTIGMFSFIIMSVAAQKAILYQADNIRQFMLEVPQVSETANPIALPEIKGEIRFRHVSFGYPARPDVLRGLGLHIRPGERVVLAGASGSGKSTILKLIGRFCDPADGEITLDGIPLHQLSLTQLREAIGFVFQETYLFHTTIRENIRFGRLDATDEEIEQAAAAAHAHDFIMQLPDGYDTVVGDRGSKLSGGQKQRIAIARMMIKNPNILLLDEAASALDHVSENEVEQALESLFQGRTIVAVAHRLSTIRRYDRIIVIADGKAAESGTYDELMARKGHFYQLAAGEGSADEPF